LQYADLEGLLCSCCSAPSGSSLVLVVMALRWNSSSCCGGEEPWDLINFSSFYLESLDVKTEFLGGIWISIRDLLVKCMPIDDNWSSFWVLLDMYPLKKCHVMWGSTYDGPHVNESKSPDFVSQSWWF
jgi:hypothetical protein